MSTETIKKALEERDEALEAKFSELAEQNEALKAKNLELADRMVTIEQLDGDFRAEAPAGKHKFGRVL